MAGYHPPAPSGTYYPDTQETVCYTPEQQLAAQQYYQHQAAANQEFYYNANRHHGEGRLSSTACNDLFKGISKTSTLLING